MKQTRHIAIAWLVLVAAGPAVCGEADRQAATVVAWARFEEASFRYADTPYLWLGHGDIRLTIHVKPDAGHVLELLWGCKNDTRGGIAVVNGQEVGISRSGYDGFRWLTVPLRKGREDAQQYEVTLKQGREKAGFIAAVRLKAPGRAPGPLPEQAKARAHKITVEPPPVPARAVKKKQPG